MLVHSLLFMLRSDYLEEDKNLATQCLKSLEKSSNKTVVIYNQGCLTNDEVIQLTKQFNLECLVIGEGQNVGIAYGRQHMFEYIWKNFHSNQFISETHLDMLFANNWEDPLIDYLNKHDEPMISCGIVDVSGRLHYTNFDPITLPQDILLFGDFLKNLRRDMIVHGFTHPVIHVSQILKEVGGYDNRFLKGKQSFEDDSLLLEYYYYYGTRAKWHPKVNYNSVVYHKTMAQRMTVMTSKDVDINYCGLLNKHGAMGLKALSLLHKDTWSVKFFNEKYNSI